MDTDLISRSAFQQEDISQVPKYYSSNYRMANPTFYQDLKMRSQFTDTHMDLTAQPEPVPLHSHSFFEILFCTDGEISYLLDARRYHLQKKDIVIIPPGVSHCPLSAEHFRAPYARIVLWANRDLMTLAGGLSDCTGLNTPMILRPDVSSAERVRFLFERGLQEAEQKKPSWQLFVLGNSLEILSALNRLTLNGSFTLDVHEEQTLLDDVFAYIEKNLSEKITLSDTAQHFLVCESLISKLFRAKAEVSFYRYVTQRRLSKAKNMMLDGVPLQEVGFSVGFQDYSTFYRAFVKEYGISPKEYKQAFIS